MPDPLSKINKALMGHPVPTKAERQIDALNKARGNKGPIRFNGTRSNIDQR